MSHDSAPQEKMPHHSLLAWYLSVSALVRVLEQITDDYQGTTVFSKHLTFNLKDLQAHSLSRFCLFPLNTTLVPRGLAALGAGYSSHTFHVVFGGKSLGSGVRFA